MKTPILILLLAFSVLSPGWAQAEKMDSETQTQVIDRLERILSRMDKKDSSWVPSNLRLADLLAERARLRFMNEIEANCKGCKGSEGDRKQALKLYEMIFKSTRAETQGVILFQMAHLFEIAGDSDKAVSLYEGILKERKGRYPADIVTRARVALADVQFQKGEFKKSLATYRLAMNDKKTEAKGLIQYRIAWCLFNLGQLNEAIKTLQQVAQTPSLLTKETAQGSVHDSAFQGDVLRDLATFYSRRPVSSNDISRFTKLLPQDQRKELLYFFADEVNRLGQKQAASEIYKSYLATPGLTQEERLDVMVQIAQVTYDKGQSSRSIEDFALAAQAFKNTRCSDDEKCLDLKKRMKRYVTELHRSKKAQPDFDVVRAYDIYVKTFPEDTEMAILGAQVASDLDKHEMAVRLYAEAARTAPNEKLRETALLGEIESAEKTKNLGLREMAYQHYLSLSPRGASSYQVRYQLAQVAYDRRDLTSAADQFRTFALDKAAPMDLRKKSADLALDSLVLQKRDLELETWALEFAGAFPASRLEYQQIARKAVINQTAQTANNKNASRRDLERALERMQSTSLAGASETERLTHFRNLSVLAEKTQDDKALLAAFAGLLSVRSLSNEERENVLAREVGFYEKKQDYKSAYETALRMKFPKLNTAEKELRLGTLADLAGLRSQIHYEKSLRAGLSGSRELSVRSRLVLLSASPLNELKKQKRALSRSPRVLGETVMLVFARTRSMRGLETYLNDKRLARETSIQFIKRQPYYPAQQRLATQIASHELNTSNDKLMGRTIQERIKLLGQAEKSLSEAVQLRDYTAQILALTMVSRENERFTRDLLNTPMPQGLTAKEQHRYGSLLKQQAKPYLVKAKIASQKLSEFWRNQRALSTLTKDLTQGREEIRPFLVYEVQLLMSVAPNSQVRSQLEKSLEDSRTLPSMRRAETAFENTKNPATKNGSAMKISSLVGASNQTQTRRQL